MYFYGNILKLFWGLFLHIKKQNVENKTNSKPSREPINLRKKSEFVLKLKLKADKTPKNGIGPSLEKLFCKVS